jgi:hypothetical protein
MQLHLGDEIPDNVVYLDGNFNADWKRELVSQLPTDIPFVDWACDAEHPDPNDGTAFRWEARAKETALKTGVYVNWLDSDERHYVAEFYGKVGFIAGRYPTANVVTNTWLYSCGFPAYAALDQAAEAIQELLVPPHTASSCEMALCIGDNLISRGLRRTVSESGILLRNGARGYPNLAWMGRPTIEQLSELSHEDRRLDDKLLFMKPLVAFEKIEEAEGPATFTAKCQVDGCGWSFSADTYAAADVARSAHYTTHPWDHDAYWKAWTETGKIPPGLDMPRYPAMSKTPR